MEKIIKNLQDKHDAFIGNQKDQITSAEARGFKQGLAWAIDTIKTLKEQEAFEHQYNLEEQERERLQNSYTYTDDVFCDGFVR